MKKHSEYWENIDEYLSAEDLDDVQKAQQRRRIRRLKYKDAPLFKGCGKKS